MGTFPAAPSTWSSMALRIGVTVAGLIDLWPSSHARRCRSPAGAAGSVFAILTPPCPRRAFSNLGSALGRQLLRPCPTALLAAHPPQSDRVRVLAFVRVRQGRFARRI